MTPDPKPIEDDVSKKKFTVTVCAPIRWECRVPVLAKNRREAQDLAEQWCRENMDLFFTQGQPTQDPDADEFESGECEQE